MRVLLADDHLSLLDAVRSLLKTDVDIVGWASDGETLFEAAMRLQPDVIVTDISMAKLSGIQAVIQLRKAGCSSRVVFLTVHADSDPSCRPLLKLAHSGMFSKPQLAQTSCLPSEKRMRGELLFPLTYPG
jgi:DNA-binding NarL/FixJ family response regulator